MENKILDSRTKKILFQNSPKKHTIENIFQREYYNISFKNFSTTTNPNVIFHYPFESAENLISTEGNLKLYEKIQEPTYDLKTINERYNRIQKIISIKDLTNYVMKIVGSLEKHELFTRFLKQYKNESEKTQVQKYSGGKINSYVNYEIYQMKILSHFSKKLKRLCKSNVLSKYYKLFEDSPFVKNLNEYIECLDVLYEQTSKITDIDMKSGLEIMKLHEERKYEKAEETREELNERNKPDIEKISSNIKKHENTSKICNLSKFYEESKSYFIELYEYAKFSDIAIHNNYVRPNVLKKEHNSLVIKNGRFDSYDLYNQIFGEPMRNDMKIIPNDTYLTDGKRIEIIEGHNNGGKSFDMKKTFYIATLALSGFWVPAEYAEISIRDKIIIRGKGIGQELSSLQEDIKNVEDIEPEKEEHNLIGLDETFMSTDNESSIRLMYGLVKHLADKKSLAVLPTHIRIHDNLEDDERISHVHFKEDHKKYPGPVEGDYAIEFTKKHVPELFE